MTSKVESAFILAAGRGERLRPLTDVTPKPLLPVQGKPILRHLLDRLAEAAPQMGLKRVVLNAWHLKEQIVHFAHSVRQSFPFSVEVSEEDELLGTAGGLKKALPLLCPSGFWPILMLNGDSLWQGDLEGFVEKGLEVKHREASWWLSKEDPEQTLIVGEGNRLTRIGNLWKDDRTISGREVERRGVFSGVQVLKVLDPSSLPDRGCIIRNYWIPRLEKGFQLHIQTFGLTAWADIGTPKRYQEIKDRGLAL